MIGLVKAQNLLQSHMLGGSGPPEGLVADRGTLTAADRLAIYREAYGLRLIEALQADFKGLHHLLGDQQFAELCRDYIVANPSQHPSIRWFGGNLATFLADDPRYRETGIFAELARFDWSVSLAFDAQDAVPLALESVAEVPGESWPDIRLSTHPSASRLDLRWNVFALRKAADQDVEPEPPRQADWPVPWVVWRKALAAKYRSMPVDEAWAWDAAARGESFAQLCEGLCEWIDPQNVGLRAAELLKVWIVDEMITGIRWDAS